MTAFRIHWERPEGTESYWDPRLLGWVEGEHCHLLDASGSSPCKLQAGHVPGCYR